MFSRPHTPIGPRSRTIRNVKPLRDRLREAFGEQEAMSVVERLNASIEGTYSYLIQTRPDLSYIPAK